AFAPPPRAGFSARARPVAGFFGLGAAFAGRLLLGVFAIRLPLLAAVGALAASRHAPTWDPPAAPRARSGKAYVATRVAPAAANAPTVDGRRRPRNPVRAPAPATASRGGPCYLAARAVAPRAPSAAPVRRLPRPRLT